MRCGEHYSRMQNKEGDIKEVFFSLSLSFLSLYICLWISVKVAETRAATKASEQRQKKQKQQRCSHYKSRVRRDRGKERERKQ